MATLERRQRLTFGRKKPPRVHARGHFDKEQSAWVVTISRVDELPVELGLLTGDAVHNYRSALDQLIFETAFMDTRGKEIESTGFPASDCSSNFNGRHVQTKLLAGLTSRHRALVRRFQPYGGWHLPGPHPLRLLHDLSNDDKHRVTQPALMCAESFDFTIEVTDLTECFIPSGGWQWAGNVLGRPVEPNTPIFMVSIVATGPNPKVDVKGKAATYVGFRNGVESVPGLRQIGNYAREIVELFAPEFERPIALRMRGVPRLGRLLPPAEPADVEITIGSWGMTPPQIHFEPRPR